MNEEPIHLAPYTAEWPGLFERERALLASVLGPWLCGPIEHIGSTAVPGLGGDPESAPGELARLRPDQLSSPA